MLLGVTSPDSWDKLSSSCVAADSSDDSEHCCPTINTFCVFIHCFCSSVLFVITTLPLPLEYSILNCSSSSGCHSNSSYRSSSFWISFHSASGSGILRRSIYLVYSRVTISFMVFVSYHTALRTLKCGHEHNKEEYSWCANEDNSNNYIISQEFSQIRHQ